MNNERTVVIKNIGTCPIGLKDTQGRRYSLTVGEKMRISEASLQDILDFTASKKIFEMGLVQIDNITPEKLYNMGLTETEIEKYLDKPATPVVVIKEEIEEEKEEIIVIEEPVVETVEEVKPVIVEEKPVVKTTAPKKTTNKKSTKKTSRK